MLKMARLNRDSTAVFSRPGTSLLRAASVTAGRSSGSPSCSACESHRDRGEPDARDARSTRCGGASSASGRSSGIPSCSACGSHQGMPASREARNGSRKGSFGGVRAVRRICGGALTLKKQAQSMNPLVGDTIGLTNFAGGYLGNASPPEVQHIAPCGHDVPVHRHGVVDLQTSRVQPPPCRGPRSRKVRWCGRSYRLSLGGRLRSRTSPAVTST